MIKEGEVRPEGCICEPCSDILRQAKLRTKTSSLHLFARRKTGRCLNKKL
jgi:hypothetical protein